MPTYKGISGFNIKSFATDPSNALQGEIWYNSTLGTLKVSEYTTGSWSAGGNLPTPMNGNSGAGVATAGLSFGGGIGPVPSYTNTSNTYDGTSWTAAPTVPFSHALGGGTGTATAAIGGGGDGNAPGAVAEFNGSTWTATPTLGFNGFTIRFVGTQSAAVGAGAYYSDNAYEWDSSTWTASGASMPVHKYSASSVGTATAGAWIAGSTVGPAAKTGIVQLYNGTSWSVGTSVPTTGAPGACCSNSSPVDDLWVAGLDGASKTYTYTWDSSSWTTTGSLTLGRDNIAAGGTDRFNGFVAGGHDGASYVSATEEFLGNVGVIKTITTS